MSYTARVYYVLESDVSYTLKYMTPSDGSITVGDSFVLQMSDFDYNNKHYYVKYAINNGDVYLRGKDGSIIANTMVISEDGNFANWFVFCTEDESEITGDSIVSMEDIASEIFLTIDGSELSTQGSEYINSIDIMQGCVSDSFASYGSTYSPTINCDMFSCEFTDALISKAYVNDVINCTMIRAWMVIKGHDYNPIPIGRFAVKENPTYNGETVSFTGNGLMSEYMDIAEVEISALNKYHKEELENKYVKTGNMDFISYDSDSYFWEFLPEDFLRVTGMPLHIDNWSDILIAIGTHGLQQLMIPVIASSTYDDDTNTYDTEFNSRITWRELLSGIAILLRGNVIEKNGAFYIKRLPEVQQDGFRPIFDASMYDSSAIFGNNLMSPSKISVKANNWLPYTSKGKNPIGFGYCDGESTVVLNDSVSSIQNVENYPVTIECPWILFETLNRNTNQGHDWYTFIGNNRAMNWQTGLKSLNRAFVYHKASFETMAWHPLMNVGDIIIVEDHDGVKRYVFVGEMTLHYNGTVYAEITSPCEVQETNTSSVGGCGSTSYNSGTTAQASGTAMSTILGAIFKDGVITNSKIADSTITGSKIAESTIDNSNIKDSTLTGSKFEDGTIENSKIKDSTLTGAKIADATIGFEKVNTSFIENLTADKAYIDNLTARIGEFGYITAENANLTYATITSLQATDGKIDTLYSKAITTENLSAEVADLGYLSAESAEIGYAKIDFSNVGTQVVSSSMIIDGAVTNEKVANLSANKITSGTIDASKITVTNLNADNITVGTINGQRIGNGSLSLDKLAEEVPTKEYLDNVEKNLQGQIDGAIETFTKSEIPTLNNEPANAWTDNETRKKHIGDVCYVLNPASSADGYCYRFANIGTEASPQYKWILIKDSDVTKALQDIIDINGEITGIKQFDTEISSWKTETDSELSSLKLRTTTLETDMGSKVESSVFNEVKQTVDENSSSIASLSTTVSKKADGSTVETLKNTVNEVKQTSDSNSLSISGMKTEIGKKADGSTVTELSQRTSNIEQNLDGFKTEVSKTYATNTELENGLSGKKSNVYASFSGNGNSAEHCYLCQIKINGNYTNDPIIIGISQRDRGYSQCHICFDSLNTKDPSLSYIRKTGTPSWYIIKSDTSTWDVYIKKSEAWERIRVTDYINRANITVTWKCENASLPSGTTAAEQLAALYGVDGTSGGTSGSNKLVTSGALYSTTTIATQTANKFNWLVKSGTSATNFELTDRTATLVANHININGLVTFSGLNSDAQNKINNAENAVNNLEIGGRNLYLGTKDFSGYWASKANWSVSSETYKGFTVMQRQGAWFGLYQPIEGVVGETYTFSGYVKKTGGTTIVCIDKEGTATNHGARIGTKLNEWEHFSVTTTVSISGSLAFRVESNSSTETTYVCGLKLEKGNKATDWTPAPEDISVENIYTPNTTTIDGGKITTGSIKAEKISSGAITTDKLAANAVTAEKINVSDLFAQDITAEGTITGATLKGAHVESTSGSIGGFEIGTDYLAVNGTSGNGHFYTGLTTKTLDGQGYGSLVTSRLFNTGETWHGSYVQISHGDFEVGRIGGVNTGSGGPSYTPTFSIINGEVSLSQINGTELESDGIATASKYGLTKLSTSVSSTSTSLAATPSAVKTAYDKAKSAFSGKGLPWAVFSITQDITYPAWSEQAPTLTLRSSYLGDRASTFGHGGAFYIYCPYSGRVEINFNFLINNVSSNGYLYARCYGVGYASDGGNKLLDFTGMGAVTSSGAQASGTLMPEVRGGTHIYIALCSSVTGKTNASSNTTDYKVRLQYRNIYD